MFLPILQLTYKQNHILHSFSLPFADKPIVPTMSGTERPWKTLVFLLQCHLQGDVEIRIQKSPVAGWMG